MTATANGTLQTEVQELKVQADSAREQAAEQAAKAAEAATLQQARDQDASMEKELARLSQQLQEERQRHLMREGELEDKMCETKIRMFQYRDESLQSLLGLDTMAELEDIVCAIKAQQRGVPAQMLLLTALVTPLACCLLSDDACAHSSTYGVATA